VRVATYLLLTVVVGSLGVAQAGFVPLRSVVFTVDASEPLAPEAIDQLAKAGAPISIDVLRGETIAGSINRHCGVTTDSYFGTAREKLAEWNNNLSVDLATFFFTQPTKVLVPFCLKLEFRGVQVTKGDTINTIYTKATGNDPLPLFWRAMDDWRWRVWDANHQLIAGSADHAKLRDPVLKRDNAANVTLRNGALMALLKAAADKTTVLVPAGTIARISANITVLNGEAYLKALAILDQKKSINVSSPGQPGELVAHDVLADGKCEAVAAEETRPPPELTVASILRALKLNEMVRKPGDPKRGYPATIFVADSGVQAIDRAEMLGLVEVDKDNPRDPDRGYKFFKHGTQVASAALGGPPFVFVNYYLDPPVRLITSNIVRKTGEKFGVDRLETERVLNRAMNDKGVIFVVNLSFRFVEPLDIFDRLARENKKLVVVSAGNVGDEIVNTANPAVLGGSWDRSVVTVAALAPTGSKADFSNWSKLHVDMAALGCDVPVFNYDEEANDFVPGRANGTSFAAPLVSFVAALIKREKGDLTPIEVKRRLLFSADLHYGLEDYVKDGRVLNAGKALALKMDVLQLKGSGRLLFGTVTLPSSDKETTGTCKRDPLKIATIRKIALRKEGDPAAQYRIYTEEVGSPTPGGGQVQSIECGWLPSSPIFFTPLGGTAVTPYGYDEIEDIVFAQR